MINQTITFEDLEGEKRTETFYFHMNKADVAEFMLAQTDSNDFEAHMQGVLERNNRMELVLLIKGLIEKSVGQRGDDGVQFIKTPGYTSYFMNSDAYSEFLVWLFDGGEKRVAEFFNGVMPKGVRDAIAAQQAKLKVDGNSVTAIDDARPQKEYSDKEILSMSQEDFDKTYGTDPTKWAPGLMVLAYQRKTAA